MTRLDGYDVLLPSRHDATRRWLAALVEAAARAEGTWRRRWSRCLDHHKGELSGQRGIDVDAFARRVGLVEPPDGTTLDDLVLATYGYLVSTAHLLVLPRLGPQTDAGPRSLLARSDGALADALGRLTSGALLETHGVPYPPSPIALAPLVERAGTQRIDRARRWLEAVADAEPDAFVSTHRNPFGRLHGALVPSELLHPTGEHDTPVWLAEQLLEDVDWTPDQSLIDPFGGSGSVLLAALSRAKCLDADPLEALRHLCMIELNPAVAALAKANLAAALAPAWENADDPPALPVLCGDALAPAVVDVGDGRQRSLLESQASRRTISGRRVDGEPHLNLETLETWRSRGEPMPAARWLEGGDGETSMPSTAQQAMIHHLESADVLVTNPPWVGWEYISEAYREVTEPLWTYYELFNSTGREAAFLKEDLSTLALTVAFDRFLTDGGRAAAVLRRATMTSAVAAGGLRRLRLEPSGVPLRLEGIRTFEDLELFEEATTAPATWTLRKGRPSTPPFSGERWIGSEATPRGSEAELDALRESVRREPLSARRTRPGDPESPWMLGEGTALRAARRLVGTTTYRARTGVFTGGANAVYYLESLDAPSSLGGDGLSWYRNLTERGRRAAPAMCTRLEEELVYDVVSGSDLTRWAVGSGDQLLCPHTPSSGMSPIEPGSLQRRCPHAHAYLERMKPTLEARRGFSGWETSRREEAFYTLLRIGPYTFAPYKVAWRYIADAFIVAVIAPSEEGAPRLPNDKLAYVGLEHAEEAYYLCALLSSSPLRWYVDASTTSTQMSAGLLDPLAIPTFDASNPRHRRLAEACRRGHERRADGDDAGAAACRETIDELVAGLYGFDATEMEAFRR